MKAKHVDLITKLCDHINAYNFEKELGVHAEEDGRHRVYEELFTDSAYELTGSKGLLSTLKDLFDFVIEQATQKTRLFEKRPLREHLRDHERQAERVGNTPEFAKEYFYGEPCSPPTLWDLRDWVYHRESLCNPVTGYYECVILMDEYDKR